MKEKVKAELVSKNGSRETMLTRASLVKSPRTSEDVKVIMSKLLAEVRNKQVDPQNANAMCNVTGKLLKMVEMEYKYGKEKRRPKRLQLV